MKKTIAQNRIIVVSVTLLLTMLACNFGGSSTTPAPQQQNPPVANTQDTAPVATKQAPSVGSIEGNYNVSGTNLDGSAYQGELVITQTEAPNFKDIDIFDLEWNNDTFGMGILIENVLAASYGTEACGAVIYTFDDAMNLSGIWLTLDTKEIGTEDAAPTEPRSTLEGNYNVTGLNPDGSEYTGALEFIEQGDVWQLIWQFDESFDGIGIEKFDIIAAAYGGEDCGVVVYEVMPDGSLEGTWGNWGTNEAGTETGTK